MLLPHSPSCSHSHSHSHSRPCGAGTGLVQRSWSQVLPSDPWFTRASVIHIPSVRHGFLWGCHGLTAVALVLGRVLQESPDYAVHPRLIWGCAELVTPQCGEHNSRHSAAMLAEEVAKGSHNNQRDRACGHRQAAVFCVIVTTQSRGGPENQQAESQDCGYPGCHGG